MILVKTEVRLTNPHFIPILDFLLFVDLGAVHKYPILGAKRPNLVALSDRFDFEMPSRPDRAEPPLDPEVAVSNAPQRQASAFLVPKMLEEES